MFGVLIKQSWWKFLLLSLLSAWLSVIDIWFGSTFFIAVAIGSAVGYIVFGTLIQNGIPRGSYLSASFLTALACLYLHFAFYTSLNYLENMVFPWQIWTALKAIARTGADVAGSVSADQADFVGTGYYTQWLMESGIMAVSAVITTFFRSQRHQ